MLSGVTQLIMMKSDVLDGFDTIKACDAYNVNGTVTRDMPYRLDDNVTPVYDELPGWRTTMSGMTSESEFPQQFSDYVRYLEQKLGVPITIVSVGPDRAQTIIRNNK